MFTIHEKGFTLIELMVVIVMIGVLSTIAIAGTASLQKKGRDQQRLSDLRLLQSALEQYHADQNYYPTATVLSQSAFNNGNSFIGGSHTYLNKLPQDPQTGQAGVTQYCYEAVPSGCTNSGSLSCTSYNLYTKLESPPSGSSTMTACNSNSYNYKLTLP